MATVSDAFTQAGTGTLTAYSANWHEAAAGNFEVSANVCYVNVSADVCAWYSGTFANDQYAEIEITLLGSAYIGPAVRCSGSDTGYIVELNNTDMFLAKLSGGTFTQLSTTTLAWGVGDVCRLEVIGTALKVYRKASGSGTYTLISAMNATDASFSSGNPGIAGFGNDTTKFDNFGGGDLGGGGTTVQKRKPFDSPIFASRVIQ